MKNKFDSEKRKTNWGISAVPKVSKNIYANDELVMAWANDKNTLKPIYIGSLERSRNGANCECVCCSCGLSLVAVNAGKDTYKTRPHFRHPKGTPKNNCLILTARAAALELLKNKGIINLPGKRYHEKIKGLSGAYYSAEAETGSEKITISKFDFIDKVRAILTLDDGRKLIVEVEGSIETSLNNKQEGAQTARITINVDLPELAVMSPHELKDRLELVFDAGNWCSHWNDQLLKKEAINNVFENMSWLDKEALLLKEKMPEITWETLLHIKAKEVIVKEKKMYLPSFLLVTNYGSTRQFTGRVVPLFQIEKEKTINNFRPDIFSKTKHDSPEKLDWLLIEIVVTNPITDEKLNKIKNEGIAALEINFSNLSGSITEQEFTRLVITESAGKKWIYHPMGERRIVKEAIENTQVVYTPLVNPESSSPEEINSERNAQSNMTLEELAAAYLQAVHNFINHRKKNDESNYGKIGLGDAYNSAKKYGNDLALRGYKEATDDKLYLGKGSIMDRLLSIKNDKAVGYFLNTAWDVINAIRNDQDHSKKTHTLYLIAIKAYKPTLNEKQFSLYEDWRQRIIESLYNGESTYIRNKKYDALLTLIFPEMREGLVSTGAFGNQDITAQNNNIATSPAQLPSPRVPGWENTEKYNELKEANPKWAESFEKSISSIKLKK